MATYELIVGPDEFGNGYQYMILVDGEPIGFRDDLREPLSEISKTYSSRRKAVRAGKKQFKKYLKTKQISMEDWITVMKAREAKYLSEDFDGPSMSGCSSKDDYPAPPYPRKFLPMKRC